MEHDDFADNKIGFVSDQLVGLIPEDVDEEAVKEERLARYDTAVNID